MVLLKQRFALAHVNVTDPAIVTVRRIGRQYRGVKTQSASWLRVPSQWFA